MIEIRRNTDGSLDEIVAENCDIHLEQMDTGHWWLGITVDGNTHCINFVSKIPLIGSAEIRAEIEEGK